MSVDLKTLITTDRPKFDINDKYLPNGNYSFTIERFGDGEPGNVTGIVTGIVKDENAEQEKSAMRELNERYTFKYYSVIQMMSKAQSQVARRARTISTQRIEGLDFTDIPSYPSPSNSPGIMRNVKLDETMRQESVESDERDRKDSSESHLSRGSSLRSSFSHSSSEDWIDESTGFKMEISGPPIPGQSKIKHRKSKKGKKERRERMRDYFSKKRKSLPKCMICLTHGHLDKKLSCGHEYHYRCIAKWYKDCEKTCPVCRAEITDFDMNSRYN